MFPVLKPFVQALFSRAPLRAVVCWRGPRRGMRVALSFDDGPCPQFTPAVLDILGKAGAQATFFVDGQRVQQHPDLVRRALAEGHEIGNHGFGHKGDPAVQAERCRRALAALGIATRLFRPPGGDAGLKDLLGLWRAGHRTVLWSFDARDSMRHEGKWRGDKPDAAAVRPGDIILMHDDNPLCTWELPQMIESLKAQGLTPATVSGLFGWRREGLGTERMEKSRDQRS